MCSKSNKSRNKELLKLGRKIQEIIESSNLNQAEKLGLLESVKLSLFNDGVNPDENNEKEQKSFRKALDREREKDYMRGFADGRK